MPDWNWFFSTLAQSAAAITGIFGAFIITKIFANQAQHAERSKTLRQLIADGKKIKLEAQACSIEWYNRTINSAAIDDINNYLSLHFHGVHPSEFSEHDEMLQDVEFSMFTSQHERDQTIKALLQERCDTNIIKEAERIAREEAEKKRADEYEERKRQGRLTREDLLADKHARMMAPYIGTPHEWHGSKILPKILPWMELNKERDKFKAIYAKAKHHTLLSHDLLDIIQSNTLPLRQISWSLLLVVAIFFIGVIYPMSFMPLSSAPQIEFSLAAFFSILFSVKGFLLAAVSLAFISVITVFLVANFKLKHSPSELTELKAFSGVGGYSKYMTTLDNQLLKTQISDS